MGARCKLATGSAVLTRGTTYAADSYAASDPLQRQLNRACRRALVPRLPRSTRRDQC